MFFSSGTKIQLDVFLPNQNLAFEYQGEQHYLDVFSLGTQWQYSMRDREKKIACNTQGISLIEVPYWWDFETDSLRATIHQHRPDLVSSPGKGVAIPSSPPKSFKKGELANLNSITQLPMAIPLVSCWDTIGIKRMISLDGG